MNTETPDADKLNAIADELAKQEDEELYALGVSLKGEMLLRAAQEDKEAIAALAEYADKIVDEAKDNELLKIPSVGLKVQAFRLQDDNEGLLAYITEELAANPAEELKQNLIDLKLRLRRFYGCESATAFDLFKRFLRRIQRRRTICRRSRPALLLAFHRRSCSNQADGADLERYNAAVEQFKADLEVCPRYHRVIDGADEHRHPSARPDERQTFSTRPSILLSITAKLPIPKNSICSRKILKPT